MIGRRDAPDDLGRLFDEHAERLLGFLIYRTGNRVLAEDVLADTFERAMTARRRPSPDSEKAWLYTIALNRLRDLARRDDAERRALVRAMPADNGHDGGISAIADRDLVQRALGGLPDDEREVLALRYGADLSLKEISSVMGERKTTVEGRIYRGLRHLREELPESGQISDRSLV